jgi:hypothetical protein
MDPLEVVAASSFLLAALTGIPEEESNLPRAHSVLAELRAAAVGVAPFLPRPRTSGPSGPTWYAAGLQRRSDAIARFDAALAACGVVP